MQDFYVMLVYILVLYIAEVPFVVYYYVILDTVILLVIT